MIVIPAIDLMGGKCVQLVEGKPSLTKVVIEDVVGTALRWQEMGSGRLHVIDLDAALDNGDNARLIGNILDAVDIPIQVGGGIRNDARAGALISQGASQIITGTRAVRDPEWLRALAARYPEKVIVAIDARGDEISIKGWTDSSGVDLFEYIKSIEDVPLFGLLYTNISREGKLQGIDIMPIQRLANETEKRLIVAGGISSIEDLEKINESGAYGAVLGMSIYRVKINLKEALERFG